MNETISKEQFAEKVLQYVREALPEELAGVKIRSASVDLWDGGSRTVLLVIRPWTDIITGFCLDRWYRAYLDEKKTVENAAAAIINDSRLYHMPQVDGLDMDGCVLLIL